MKSIYLTGQKQNDTKAWGQLKVMKHIKFSDFSLDMLSRMSGGIPILLCESFPRIEHLLKKASFTPINLNIELAKELLDQVNQEDFINVSLLARQIINRFEGPLLLTNFEMLFDPRHNLNVIRLFIDFSRLKPIVVDCSSYIREGRLEYSEPHYEDYQVYDLAAYPVICII